MPLDPDQFQSLADFRFTLRAFVADSEAICRRAGVTSQQYQALLAIRARPGSSMKKLAEQLLLTQHAAVQLMDRLAAADLAGRTPSPSDRRRVLVDLTDPGRSLLDRLATEHMTALQQHAPRLQKALAGVRRAKG